MKCYSRTCCIISYDGTRMMKEVQKSALWSFLRVDRICVIVGDGSVSGKRGTTAQNPNVPPFLVPVLSWCRSGDRRKHEEWRWRDSFLFPFGRVLWFFFITEQLPFHLPNSLISFPRSPFFSVFFYWSGYGDRNLLLGQYPRISFPLFHRW